MAERVFVDTNVFVYAADEDAGVKRDRARTCISELAREGRAVVSTQELSELFVASTRKLGIAPDRARQLVASVAQLDVVVLRQDHILSAIDLLRLSSISFWDALILRAAAAAGCAQVLTEDLNHGQVFDGIRIENPFR